MEVSYLVEKLYKLATHTDGLTDAARSIAILTRSHKCSLMVHDINEPMPESGWFWGVDMGKAAEYRRYYTNIDPKNDEIFNYGDGKAYASPFNRDNPEFIKTEFFRDWSQPQNLAYYAGAYIMLDERYALRMSLLRGFEEVQYEDSVLRDIETLLPHLKRCLAIHKRFNELNNQVEVMDGALSDGRQALILVDAERNVQHCNEAAKKMMTGCLRLVGSSLRANRKEVQAVLEGALKAGCSMLKIENEQTPAGGFHVGLERPGKLPLSLFLTPVRMTGPTKYTPFSGLFLRIQLLEPNQCIFLEPRQLEQVLGLTAAEARVAARLCTGASAVEIGKCLGISPHTVRDHTRNVYRRVGVSRQSEFVAKAYAVLTPNTLASGSKDSEPEDE